MSQPSTQDLVKGIDLTDLAVVSGSQLDQLADNAQVGPDTGMVLITLDIAGVPQVPDANTNTKWRRYIWERKTAVSTILYVWVDSAVSDATYLQWQNQSQIAIAPNTITNAMLMNSIIDDSKVSGISASKISGLPAAFPPNGAAGGDLTGTYPNPTIGANAVTDTKLASDAAVDANRAVGNNHIKTQVIASVGATGKLSIFGSALQFLRVNAGATALEAATSFFTQLATLGTASQRPRVNAGATAIEWVDDSVIQRLSKVLANGTGAGAIPFDSTIPQKTEGDALISLAITPKLSTSYLRIRFNALVSNSTAANVIISLFQDAGADAINASVTNIGAANQCAQVSIEYHVAAVAGVATTLAVRIGTTAGTYAYNQGSTLTLGAIMKSYLSIEEINETLS